MNEILQSLKSTNQWWALAIFDIKQRYRRSTLGPFWVTISTGILILALGFLWAYLFKMKVEEFMPFFAAGYILWTFTSSQINESCTGYTQFESYIKQINLPLPLYILRIWARNLIIFGHNFIILIGVWIYFKFDWTPNIPLALIGLMISTLIIFFISIPIATLCTRYRDISPIIQNAIQIIYFFTPIMWQKKVLPERYFYLVDSNPLFHIFEIVRAPLLGQQAAPASWYWSISLLFISIGFAMFIHKRYRKRVAYWL
jgi:lipopolysaccharide transport system permease protein